MMFSRYSRTRSDVALVVTINADDVMKPVLRKIQHIPSLEYNFIYSCFAKIRELVIIWIRPIHCRMSEDMQISLFYETVLMELNR